MTVTADLLLATLSLDAYNQGYDERIEHGKTEIGGAVFRSGDNSADAQAAGFYAAAYDVPAGVLNGANTLVISYRGTDDYDPFSPTSDVSKGWVTGTGTLGPQARLATFYG